MKTQIWHSRLTRLVGITLGAALLMSRPAVAQTYTVTSLGTLDGTLSEGVAINPAGQYNLAASSLGVGHYRIDIAIDGTVVGHADFALN